MGCDAKTENTTNSDSYEIKRNVCKPSSCPKKVVMMIVRA
jgi:hypothetical protein